MIHTFKGKTQARTTENLDPVTIRRKADPATGLGAGKPYTEHRRREIVTKQAPVELTIDVDRLIRVLGEKAIKSKGGRSSHMSGAIKLKLTGSRTEIGRDAVTWHRSDLDSMPDLYEEVPVDK